MSFLTTLNIYLRKRTLTDRTIPSRASEAAPLCVGQSIRQPCRWLRGRCQSRDVQQTAFSDLFLNVSNRTDINQKDATILINHGGLRKVTFIDRYKSNPELRFILLVMHIMNVHTWLQNAVQFSFSCTIQQIILRALSISLTSRMSNITNIELEWAILAPIDALSM